MDACARNHAEAPAPARLDRALRLAADLLGAGYCWLYRGDYHFALDRGWTIAIRPESAGRFRVSCCQMTVARSTVWVCDGDDERLTSIVTEMSEAAAVVA